MTESKARQKIVEAGGKWKDFLVFIQWKTVGVYGNGKTNFYDWDVERFIANNCDKNTVPFN